jgi:hypothetical protein
MKTTTLGKYIDNSETRDAIHIAIAPVSSNFNLRVGEHIDLVEASHTMVMPAKKGKGIGIVDPFLDTPNGRIPAGKCFFMLLYPQTITSLNHSWEHPAFDKSVNKSVKNDQNDIDFLKSVRWIEDYAGEINVQYKKLMFAAENWVKNDEYWCDGDRFEGEWIPNEFWDHFEIVTGKKVDENNRGSFFTCSC